MKVLIAAGAVAYACSGFLTFGHLYNVETSPPALIVCGAEPDGSQPMAEWRSWQRCDLTNREITAGSRVSAAPLFAGIAWPIYWAGKGAIVATKGGA